MAFYVGQRVVCVRDDNDVFGREMIIKKGSIYTVASLVTSNWGRDGVTLVEVSPPPGVVGWLNELFRPITERKTDISIFKAMLNPSKQEVSA
jgi:hypothetical protein